METIGKVIYCFTSQSSLVPCSHRRLRLIVCEASHLSLKTCFILKCYKKLMFFASRSVGKMVTFRRLLLLNNL